MTDPDVDNPRTSHDLASSTVPTQRETRKRGTDDCQQHVDYNDDGSHRVDDDKSLWKVLDDAFPHEVVQDARIVQTIVQENAVGTIIRVVLVPTKTATVDRRSKDDDAAAADAAEPAPTSSSRRSVTVFVKRVSLQDYVLKKKDWPDLRRTLLYARTEARFYDEILPLLLRRMLRRSGTGAASSNDDDTCQSNFPNHLTPHVYLSTCNFLSTTGWIDDDEVATRPASTDYPEVYYRWKSKTSRQATDAVVRDDDNDEAGWIVLECVDPHKYYQDSPLLPSQSFQCLQAVARLHAAAWQDQELLEKCQRRLSRASFHLAMRNPKELEGIVDSWDQFRVAFHEHLAKEGLDTPAFVQLGTRIQRLAVHVSQFVSPDATDNFATLIHGDYKSLNVFLPREGEDDRGADNNKCCLMVDFASCGVGLGMSDLAMHVRHAVEPQYLENGGEEKLVRQYWEYLTTLLPEHDVVAAHEYTWDVAWTHYKVAVVDYFRFFLGRMWKSATPDTMRSKSSNKNVSLINRSVPAAMAFLKNVEGYMTEIEAEYGAEYTL